MARIEPAIGIVKMIDKATSPLRNIGKSFKRLANDTAGTNQKLTNFQSKLSKTSKKLNQLNRSFQKGKKAAKGYVSSFSKVASIGGIIAGGGVIAAVKNQADSLDKLGKTAQNLKMPVSELQAMRHQANLTGLSTQDLDSNMIRFTKRLGVFQTTGGGLFATIAKKIGGGFAESLKGAETNTEAYAILLETYKKLTTQQSKMALSDAAFGMSGRRTLIMLEEGLDGLKRSRQELIDLGAVVTKEDIRAAAEYNDAFTRLGAGISGIKIKVLTPVIQNLTGTLKRFVINMKNVDYREALIEKVAKVITGLMKAMKGLAKGVIFLSENWKSAIAGVIAFKFAMIGLNSIMAMSKIGMIVSAVGLLATGAYLLTQNWQSLKDSFNSMPSIVKVLTTGIAGLTAGFLLVKGAALLFATSISIMTPVLGLLKGVIGTLRIVFLGFNAVLLANPIGVLVLGVTALTIGAIALAKNWDVVTQSLKDTWEWLKKIGNMGFDGIASMLGFGDTEIKAPGIQQPNARLHLPQEIQQTRREPNLDFQKVQEKQEQITNQNINRIINNISLNVEGNKMKSIKSDGEATTNFQFNTGVQQ